MSVVIPTYNRARLLGEALDSVLAQTRTPDEIIVVDDGSSDSTLDTLSRHRGRVVVLVQPHLGPSTARNAALRIATGQWIAFLDSDDIWRPTKLERQLELVATHPDYVCVHTNYFAFGTEGEQAMVPRPRFLQGVYGVEFLLFGADWVCPSSALVRRDVSPIFREWAEVSEDIIYFAELTQAGPFGYLPDALVGYRTHSDAANAQPRAQTKGATFQLRWLRETFASESDDRARLERHVFQSAVGRLSATKWTRQWPAYWEWRDWLASNWPVSEPTPTPMRERIYPPLVYAVRDLVDRFRSRPVVR